MRITVERRSRLDETAARMARASTALRGAPKRVSLAFDDPTRNSVIANAQARRGRNPFYLAEPEAREARALLRQGVRDTRQTGEAGPFVAALHAIGGRMVAAAQRHINLGLTKKKGAVTHEAPLTPAYAAAKRKAVGQKPILRFTDELYRAIRFVVGR